LRPDVVGPTLAPEDALALEVVGGHDPMDATSAPEPQPAYGEHLDDGVDGLRVGIVREMLEMEGVAPDVAARVRAAADALAAAGATVEEVSVPAVTYGLSAYYLIAPAEASSNLARFDGVRYYDAFYGKAQRVRTLIAREFAAAYGSVDVLLSPTSPTTAFALGDKTADPLTMYLNDVCTIPSNLSGDPAISVPFGSGADGLPVGVQVMAPALAEVDLFRTAAVLEEAASRG